MSVVSGCISAVGGLEKGTAFVPRFVNSVQSSRRTPKFTENISIGLHYNRVYQECIGFCMEKKSVAVGSLLVTTSAPRFGEIATTKV